MKNVFFKPWVGRDYDSGGMFGKKILAVGEAHVCGADCPDCGVDTDLGCDDLNTKGVVQNYLHNHSGGWSRTFRKFERALYGDYTDDLKSREIWDSIVFYNYVQRAMTKSRISPLDEDYQKAEVPFFSVVNTYKPDAIIVWGQALYNNMSYDAWTRRKDICIDGCVGRNGMYTIEDGVQVPTLCINHPSSGFNWEKWHKIINHFLKTLPK